ncbi:acyltransferase family protein [Paenibacillus thermotolerans]|uniref:acyltransferase family protein n=1 Tax=Paenibacillus thermotolerans TaxID=3027807 RepID=UPI0023685B87|nr:MULTISPECIES: acyltransferase family protein [unclassified Paenibacillus]
MATAKSMNPNIEKGRYMPGLDGLRALSVIAVIAYHLDAAWAPGGFLGVGVFFTLSGYLITDQLLVQWKNTGSVDLKHFWIRRARRLLPAMFVMLAVVGAWLFLFDRQRLIALQDGFLSAALYIHNWWLIFHNVSYFESFGPPSPIGHLWSLAIEEQFYIFWPLLLMIALHRFRQRGGMLLFIFAGAAASVLAMAFIYVPGTDPSRVYYGTDTRVFALLIGAALATVWPSNKLTAKLSARSRWSLDLIGAAGIFAVIRMIWTTNEYDESLYRGGLALFSLLTAFVTAVLAHPASIVGKLMGSKPLRWIGKRSYSLYLWHYPVIILTTPTVDAEGFHAGRAVFQVLFSMILSSLSWKFVEEPMRNGSYALLWGKIRRWTPTKPRYVFALSLFSLLLISCSGSLKAGQPLAVSSAGAAGDTTDRAPATVEKAPPVMAEELPPPAVPEESAPAVPEESPPPVPEESAPENTKAEAGSGITAIGDSVLLDAAPHLEKLLPGIVIDGQVGRQMSEAKDVVKRLKEEGKLGDRIIIELGTNGSFSKKYLRELLASLEQDTKQIFIVNTRVPRKWQDAVNRSLEEVAKEFPKATVIDWYSASKGKGSYFADDGVHLKDKGARYYTSVVTKAIQQGEQ